MFAGRTYLDLAGFAPSSEWELISKDAREGVWQEVPMTYSYTQISQYLRCPRSYRYRYLDGWHEKDTRAAMVFGRCFETALGAYFRKEDPSAVLFKEWNAFRDSAFEYKKGDSWDRLLHQGIHLLQKFAQDDRVQIRRPKENLQVKILRALQETMSSFLTLMLSVCWMAKSV